MTLVAHTFPVSPQMRAVIARLDRAIAAQNARVAREIARPGEPHAAARARLCAVQTRISDEVARVLIWGER